MKSLSVALISAIIFCSCSNADHPSIIKDSTEHSEDWAMLSFERTDSVNPILVPGTNSFMEPITQQKNDWEAKDVFNPAIVIKDHKVFMLYRAQDKTGKPDGTSRIGLAESLDGIHFTKHATPVLFPDNDAYKKYEWQGGCEDPRIVEDDKGTYYMTYTAYDGKLARLLIATSTDLLHWKKQGSVFADAYQGKYLDKWSKSGSIVSTYANGKIIATKINGKYWMYWGDVFIWAATSDDLIHWTPLEMKEGEQAKDSLKSQALNMPSLQIIIPTRRKKFDSDLVESGPPAMLTDKGILLIYNSRNIKSIGDTSLPEGTYAAGQVLLDKNDPTKIIKRLNHYFIKPERPYEITGQVNQVCFLEGLCNFNHQWFLYYGTADSKIAVAVRKE
jgi:predicted GH43/DUF377 family glycosyl hydrolase